jgi:formylglycine-generating enzyme required for sulfatase activity
MAFHLIPLAGQALQSIAKGLLNKAITNYFKERTPSTQELALQELVSVGRANKELREKELEVSLLQIRFQHEKMLKDIDLKEKQIQSEHDKTKWSSLLSRAEIQAIFSEQKKNHRLLVIASEPDMPEDLPLSFRDGLKKKVRNDLKRFSNNYYAPEQTQGAVEFYGKFFDRAVFDAEIRQLRAVLPVPTVVIYCDITHHEAYFNVEYLNRGQSFSFNTDSWAWRDAEEQLQKEGIVDEHKRLFEIQNILVKMHQTLLAFLTDWYYLQLSPFYQPQLFELKDNFSSVLPPEWTDDCVKILQQIQRANLNAYQAEMKRLELEEEKKRTFSFEVVVVDKYSKEIKRQTQSNKHHIVDLGKGVKLEMVSIPKGRVKMGNSDDYVAEIESFYMGKYPITVGQFKRFVEETRYQTTAEKEDGAYVRTENNLDWEKKKDANWRNPYFKQTDKHPVVCVSWLDAVKFCEWLSIEKDKKYRLPTEAEWEYACRGGTTTPFHFGEIITTELANYDGKYLKSRLSPTEGEWRKQTVEVDYFKHTNNFGLYQMHGNVWEWTCSDWYGDYARTFHKKCSMMDNVDKSMRGGSWMLEADLCCSGYRRHINPSSCFDSIGFRVASPAR